MQRAVVGLGMACAMLLALAWPASASRGIQFGRGDRQAIGVSGVLTLRSDGGIIATCNLLLTFETDGTIYKGVLVLPTWEFIVSPSSLTSCSFPISPGATVNTAVLLSYLGFSGTLPSITGIDLAALPLSMTIGTVFYPTPCIYTSYGRVRLSIGSGSFRGIEFNSMVLTTNPGSPPSCPGSWTISGALRTFLGSPPGVTLI